jgi:hypothetical protein
MTGQVSTAAENMGQNALNRLRHTMALMSEFMNSEIDDNPVITPILDLDGMQAGAHKLNRLLKDKQTYALATAQLASDKIAVNNQNGSSPVIGDGGTTITNQFNLNGVVIRDEADIDKIAAELYRKQETGMRSRGIRPAYT